MRLFLDTSVLLSACASERVASRSLFHHASANGWVLVTTHYALDEVRRHLPELPDAASAAWTTLHPSLLIMDDVVTLKLPAVFPVPKDKPIHFGALAWADVLLTLDHGDFSTLLGTSFYGLPILKPGTFLERERAAGRLR
jgi:predicted nucleic acid-binding protein